MVFSTSIFLFFFLPICLGIYYVIEKKFRNIFLLLISIYFYAWGEPKFIFIMICSVIANYIFGLLVNYYRNIGNKAKLVIFIMVTFNIGIFFVFKYLDFTIQNINLIFNSNISVKNILLPIGISFFTFQAISYVIDVYRGKGEVQKNPLNVGLYIMFFPQLIAGPIVRYETVASEIKNRKESLRGFSEGTCRFIIGLGKKVIIANNVALVADEIFTMRSGELSIAIAWLGAIAYTLQVYFDFSGYSDMAIGLGKMFGFNFLENFNYPYVAKSISEFWRRWHISLGTWFRDYVYIPLGGSRVNTKTRLVFNLLVVWLLTGIWHGANWTFICWGILYFILLTFEKLFNIDKKLGAFGHVYTIFFVMIGWVLFRAESLYQATQYISSLFGINTDVFMDDRLILLIKEYGLYIIMGIILSTPLTNLIKNKLINVRGYRFVYVILHVSILVIAISFIAKGSYSPFIYFNF